MAPAGSMCTSADCSSADFWVVSSHPFFAVLYLHAFQSLCQLAKSCLQSGTFGRQIGYLSRSTPTRTGWCAGCSASASKAFRARYLRLSRHLNREGTSLPAFRPASAVATLETRHRTPLARRLHWSCRSMKHRLRSNRRRLSSADAVCVSPEGWRASSVKGEAEQAYEASRPASR